MKRYSALFAAGLLLASVVGVAPVSAQQNNNGGGGAMNGSTGCTSTNTGGPTTGGAAGGNQRNNNPSNSTGVLTGLVDVLVQDVSALNNVQAPINAQISNVANNLSVVCLNDVLNQNDIRILQDILNNSPILNNDLNNSLNNNTVLQGFLNNNNIANNVQVVGVNLGTGQVFVLGH